MYVPMHHVRAHLPHSHADGLDYETTMSNIHMLSKCKQFILVWTRPGCKSVSGEIAEALGCAWKSPGIARS